MTEPTPGPYEAFIVAVVARNARGTDRMLAAIHAGEDDDGNRISLDEVKATAKLLAASPAMFAALKARQLADEHSYSCKECRSTYCDEWRRLQNEGHRLRDEAFGLLGYLR